MTPQSQISLYAVTQQQHDRQLARTERFHGSWAQHVFILQHVVEWGAACRPQQGQEVAPLRIPQAHPGLRLMRQPRTTAPRSGGCTRMWAVTSLGR